MKYNDNGEYNNIYVKSFDTLPVGTEVDFDGDSVPSGWTTNNNVLWTNPSPTSNFAGQSITLSEAIENFSEYEVIYKRQASANTFISSGKLPISSRNRIDLANGYLYSRAISVLSGTTLTFGDCTYYATYGSTTTTNDNSTLIPYMVICYKGKIKKTSQYINGGASLSNVYGTSQSNGYSQEYINGLGTYSTDEVRVGTWLGKPLYRRIINITAPDVTTAGTVVQKFNDIANYTNIDTTTLRIKECYIKNNNRLFTLMYMNDSGYWIKAYPSVSNNIPYVVIASNATNYNSNTGYAIIEYTKTTD